MATTIVDRVKGERRQSNERRKTRSDQQEETTGDRKRNVKNLVVSETSSSVVIQCPRVTGDSMGPTALYNLRRAVQPLPLGGDTCRRHVGIRTLVRHRCNGLNAILGKRGSEGAILVVLRLLFKVS